MKWFIFIALFVSLEEGQSNDLVRVNRPYIVHRAESSISVSTPTISNSSIHISTHSLNRRYLREMYPETSSLEHSIVRKCGFQWDDRFHADCPYLREPFPCRNAVECALKCSDNYKCRSWSFENDHCSLFKMTLRGVHEHGSTSGDIDPPIRILKEATIAKEGSNICVCGESNVEGYISLLSITAGEDTSHRKLRQEMKRKAFAPVAPMSCLSLIETCRIDRQLPPSSMIVCSPINNIKYQTVVTIAQNRGEFLFHFMIEGLVRWASLPPSLRARAGSDDLKVHIVGGRDLDRRMELLEMVGVARSSIVVGQVRAHSVIVSAPTSCGTPSRNQVLSLRRLLLSSEGFLKATQQHREEFDVLIIQRSKSRLISNIDQLVTALRAISMVKVFQDTDHRSQASILSMFSRASIIVASHGAGLSNMVVGRSCTTIIEARAQQHPRCYEHLAKCLGFRYQLACGSGVVCGGNLTVNVESVVEQVQQALEREGACVGGA